MIKKGGKSVNRLYKGYKHIIRLYKGLQLIHRYVLDAIEVDIVATTGIFSSAATALRKLYNLLRVDVSAKSEGRASLSYEQGCLISDEGLISSENAAVEKDAVSKVEAEGKVFSDAYVIGGAGHTEPIKVAEISFTATDVTLTDHSGNIQAEEQHIVQSNIAHFEAGTAHPQAAENHILFTQSVPTVTKGQAMYTKKTDMSMHLTDTATGGAGYAKPQKAETHGFFSYVKPSMLAQKIMPEMQTVKSFFKSIASIGDGKAKPQSATENNIFFTAEPATVDFGYVLSTPEKTELHIADTVSGGVGHAKPQSATAESYFENLAQLTDDTTDVTAETAAHSGNIALFEKGYGNGIKAADGGISGSDSVVYKPEKVFKIDNAGGISGADSTVHKPDKLFKTDTLIQSSAFARLFRVVQLSAVTTAKLISKPPLFRYVFLGASGGGMFSGGGILDIATPDEFNQWHYQQGNTLYIFTASTTEQTETQLAIDTGSVNVWHERTDNVLYIYVTNTAQQTETQLEIDTAITEEWAVQTDNVLYINRLVEAEEIEVI